MSCVIKLRKCLMSLKCEVNAEELSTKLVEQNSSLLKEYINGALLLASDIALKQMRPAFTSLLLDDTQKMCKIASNLRVHHKTERSAYYHLHRVRRKATVAQQLANLLHEEISMKVSTTQESPHSTAEAQSAHAKPASIMTASIAQSAESQPITTRMDIIAKPSTIPTASIIPSQPSSPNPSLAAVDKTSAYAYWKPSLNRPFFLKSPVLTFDGLTEDHVHSLNTTLVKSQEKQTFVNANNDSKEPTMSASNHLSGNVESLECQDYSLMTSVRSNLLSPSGDTISANCEDTTAKSDNTVSVPHEYWKPSLKMRFFLKQPALIFEGLTNENRQKLLNTLKTEEQTTVDSAVVCESDKTDFDSACRDPVKPTTPLLTSPETYQPARALLSSVRKNMREVLHEIRTLCFTKVHSSLLSFKTALKRALSLVKDMTCKHITAEFTKALKQGLKSIFNFAKKLYFLNKERDGFPSQAFNRARYLLNSCLHTSALLHSQVKASLTKKETACTSPELSINTQSLSDKPPAVYSFSPPRVLDYGTATISTGLDSEYQPFLWTKPVAITALSSSQSTTSSSCETRAAPYWKPSLNEKFFLKPPTLVFNGLTEENRRSLAVAVNLSTRKILTPMRRLGVKVIPTVLPNKYLEIISEEGANGAEVDIKSQEDKDSTVFKVEPRIILGKRSSKREWSNEFKSSTSVKRRYQD